MDSKQKAAADAQRVDQARQRIKERQQAKSLLPQIMRNWNGEVQALSSFRDDDEDIPRIHPALGRWPENSVPNIYWDLTDPGTWTYKRPFTEEELEISPFSPFQKKMIILLRPDQPWTITIKPRAQYRVITLRCFQESMIKALQQEVPFAIWRSASVWQKYDIALAFFRRTGALPIIPSMDVFEEWKKYLTAHANDPEATDYILRQMTEYVTRGVTRTMTRLQTVDLLGHSNLFAGLTYMKEDNYWVMSTTCRHVVKTTPHMQPRSDAAITTTPNAVLNAAPEAVPNIAPNVVANVAAAATLVPVVTRYIGLVQTV